MGQIITSLAIYNRLPLTPDARLYLLRLVSPQMTMQALNPGSDEFLYVPRNLYYAQNLLLSAAA
jgi:hypothetical protein